MPLTVERVKLRLKLDDDLPDDDIQEMLEQAEQVVKDHILDKYDPEHKSHQLAILMMCGYLDENRADKGDIHWEGGLPEPVLKILERWYVPLCL